MNDIDDQKTIDRTEQAALDQTAEQQAFSEEIRRRLAAPDSGKPTLEEFKVMVYKDREKRRKKRNALVACLVAAFIVGYLAFDELVPEVGADKNPKETIQTEDGVIIEDGGYGSSTGEDDVWVITDWNAAKNMNKHFEELLVPQYIPNEYGFSRLTIKFILETDYIYEYVFTAEKKETVEIEGFVTNNNKLSLSMDNIRKVVNGNKGLIYIHEDENKATIVHDNGSMIVIWGELSEKDLLEIVNNFSN